MKHLAFALMILTSHTLMANKEELLALVKQYELAANCRSPKLFQEILALDDPQFTEIEDHIAKPFGSDVVREIHQWIREHPDFSYKVEYKEMKAFLLSGTVGYVVAMNEWQSDHGEGEGRTTFIMKKYDDEWKIVHGHWSDVPK